MSFQPDQISKQHVLAAIEKIDQNNLNLNASTRYDVIINNRAYPPKDVMRFAHRELNGELRWEVSGGEPTNRYLRAMGFQIVNKHGFSNPDNTTEYYVLGSMWQEDQEYIDKTELFVAEGYWENGYSDKFLDIVAGVKVGSRVAIKSSFATKSKESILRVKSLGTVTNNEGDGRVFRITWDAPFPAYDLVGYGGYRKTIEKVSPEDIEKIFFHNSLSTEEYMDTDKATPKNIILYGPPGTGKTYSSIGRAVELATRIAPENHAAAKIEFDRLRSEGQIAFITFHQNYSYEDFMIGIRPDATADQHLRFASVPGIFYQLSKRAQANYLSTIAGVDTHKPFNEVFAEFVEPLAGDGQEIEIKMASGSHSFWITDLNEYNLSFRKQSGDTQHTLSLNTLHEIYEGTRIAPGGLRSYYNPLVELLQAKGKKNGSKTSLLNYVLVIDEINRANISRVFGELITLLEEDKRIGAENELRINLANGDEFAVPPNLFVLGTMNTADKSIALVDIALRRRFKFEGKYPEYGNLSLQSANLLRKLNAAIFKEKGSADYLIGHAYFMTGSDISDVLLSKVIPLLMEYFSGKIERVQDVFANTDWTVQYDLETYSWKIAGP